MDRALPFALLKLPLAEWRHHPWRHLMALAAVALGVALAYSVHLINSSALAEFSAAVRSVSGEPDLTLRGAREGFDDALHATVALDPAIEAANPVAEVETIARLDDGRRMPLRLVGIDALRIGAFARDLLPRPAPGADRLAAIDPDRLYLNAGALAATGVRSGDRLTLQAGRGTVTFVVGGEVAAAGAPLGVLDLSAVQARFGLEGRLTRIDLRLAPGADVAAAVARWSLPAGITVARPGDDLARASSLSRAYRVNLTVLALVALFVGAFLVYSMMALSVAERTPALALLGVLGLDARGRRRLVLAECAVLGLGGAALGLALGTLLAAAALRWMAGDLGGGFFPGVQPPLRLTAASAVVYGLLGLGSALVGGWWPARQAERLPAAQALKGLGTDAGAAAPLGPGLALVALGAGLALLPPVGGVPLAAYGAVAALLFGGVALVPAALAAGLRAMPPRLPVLPRLALARARWHRRTATAMVAGVVASLALSVALTVMVASFRDGVARWLDTVLPADLYLRAPPGAGRWLVDADLGRLAAVPGVARIEPGRSRALTLRPELPAVALLARPLAQPERVLALEGPRWPAAPGEAGVWISEPVAALYRLAPGAMLALPLAPDGRDAVPLRVLGVFRDYARTFGAIAIDLPLYRRLTGDAAITELSVWTAPGADAGSVTERLRAAIGGGVPPESASAAELRRISLAIFDRSFAVTVYLQAVAVAIGLVGVAAALSAQVLARRKEFGLLAHLGFSRAEVLRIVLIEVAAVLGAGIAIGVALGFAVSLVLVEVVNPQSFHWTMELRVPGARLAALAIAVLVAGLATAALTARRAAGRDAVLAVKEDW